MMNTAIPFPARPRRAVPSLLTTSWRLLRDMGYGVSAANAILHGLPVPRRTTGDS